MYVSNAEEKQERMKKYLKGRKFTKVKFIERELGISRTEAGRLLMAMGWKVWGGKGCGNKTYMRPEMKHLVLSLFPGVDLFGMAFEREGFCVVRGPDIIYGQDVRTWSVISGRFDVVIGGPPCKLFSSARRGNPTDQGNLIPEFERIVKETQPRCFVMENLPEAPIPHVANYSIKDYLLNSHDYGANQSRKRRFTFGYPNDSLNFFPFYPEDPIPHHKREPDPFPTVIASEHKGPRSRAASRKVGRSLTLAEICELQGVPEMAEAWCFLPRGKSRKKVYRKEFEYELIGNGVEMRVGRVVARAVRRGLEILEKRKAV
jgi:DNA (cytosine-5)-methyltransferase 1